MSQSPPFDLPQNSPRPQSTPSATGPTGSGSTSVSQNRSAMDLQGRMIRDSLALQEQLRPLLQDLQINHWDALLIGDGSGSGWNIGCGWASTLFDKRTGCRKLFHGATNYGTAMLAELMASYWPLSWYAYHRDQRNLGGLCQIHVITDNQASVQQCAKHRVGELPKACTPFWAMIAQMEQSHKFRIELHWVRRVTLGSAHLADIVAGNARVAMENLSIPGARRSLSDYAYLATLVDCPELEELHRP